MFVIPDDTKTLITEYLNKFMCPRTLTGYTILVKVIYMAVDDELYSEDINCEEIFRDYTDRIYDGNNTGDTLWKAPYRAARYCILRSSYVPSNNGRYSIPEFIQDGRDYVLTAKKERESNNSTTKRGLVRAMI